MIAIFVLAGIADIFSGDPAFHAAALFAVAIALSADSIRRRLKGVSEPASARAPIELRLTPTIAVVGLVYAAVAGSFSRYTWPATFALLIPGAVGVAIAWRGRAGPGTAPEPLTRSGALLWAGVFVALALWELTQLLLQPSLTTSSWAHPTISTMMDPVLASHLRRSLFIGGWLSAGWYLVTR